MGFFKDTSISSQNGTFEVEGQSLTEVLSQIKRPAKGKTPQSPIADNEDYSANDDLEIIPDDPVENKTYRQSEQPAMETKQNTPPEQPMAATERYKGKVEKEPQAVPEKPQKKKKSDPAEFLKIPENAYLKGDFMTNLPILIQGEVDGAIRSDDHIDIDTPSLIKTDIISGSDISVSGRSRIVGNIEGVNINILGAVKGSVKASGRVTLSENSVIAGDIEANTFEAAGNSLVTGSITLSADKNNVNVDAIFGDAV